MLAIGIIVCDYEILILCIYSVLQKSFYDIEKTATNKSKNIFLFLCKTTWKKLKFMIK